MKIEVEMYENARKALNEIFEKSDEAAAVYYFGQLTTDRLEMGAKLAHRIFNNTAEKLTNIEKGYMP